MNTPLLAARGAFALAVLRLASNVNLSDGLVVRGRLLSRHVRSDSTPPDPGHAPPDFSFGWRCSATRGRVLRGLAGIRRLFHSPSPVRHGGAFRRRSWGSPFAVLLLPAGPRRFRPGLPPAVSRTIHPGLFSRGTGAGVRLSSGAGRGRSPRLLGFVPAGNPFRRLLAGFRRPRLPWAFSSLRFADRRTPARRRIIAPAGSLSAPLPGPIRSWAWGESFPVFVAITRLPHARRRGHEPWNECRDEPSTPFNSRRAHPCSPPPAPDCSSAKRQDHSPALQRIEGLLPCRSPGENSYAHGLRPCVPPRPPRDRQPV